MGATKAIDSELTEKQLAFCHSYATCYNATTAAKNAGYTGDYRTLQSIGSENLSKPIIKEYLRTLFASRMISDQEIIDRIRTQATADLSDCIDETGELSVELLKEHGKGHLIREIMPTREGTRVKVHDQQKAMDMLTRVRGLYLDKQDLTTGGQPLPDKQAITQLTTILERIAQADDTE